LVSGRRCSFLASANASIGIGVVLSDCIQFNQPIALVSMNAQCILKASDGKRGIALI
jgi:hypothetical protein